MRRKGAGSIYKQKNCRTWTIKYYKGGKCHREATHLSDYQAARQMLNRKLAKIAEGTYSDVKLDRIRVEELMEPFFEAVTLRASEAAGNTARRRWANHLAEHFTGVLVVNVTSEMLTKYANMRLAAGAERATCNRELAVLRGAFKLAAEGKQPKVANVPKFPSIKETNVRSGFVDDAQYSRLVAQGPPAYMRAIMEVAFEYGWREHELVPNRVKGALVGGLRVRQVNLREGTISLDAGTTKNADARLVVMTNNVRQLLSGCLDGKTDPDAPVFTRPDGSPVVNFDRQWKRITKGAGLPNLIFHDLRRSAIRNMVNAGISEKVAMQISGHRSRKIFDRYHIVPKRDLQEAAKKSEARRLAEAVGHDYGHDSAETTSTPATKLN